MGFPNSSCGNLMVLHGVSKLCNQLYVSGAINFPIRKPPPIHSVFFLFAWLPLQLLSFGQTALACIVFPTSLVPEVPCGLAHHVGKVTRFHFRSCVSYTIANHTGFRGSLLPGCLAHHAGKKGLAFTARALLSLGLSQSIATRAGFGASRGSKKAF